MQSHLHHLPTLPGPPPGHQTLRSGQDLSEQFTDNFATDNIETALSGYFRRETLGQGENMYKCDKCGEKVGDSVHL